MEEDLLDICLKLNIEKSLSKKSILFLFEQLKEHFQKITNKEITNFGYTYPYDSEFGKNKEYSYFPKRWNEIKGGIVFNEIDSFYIYKFQHQGVYRAWDFDFHASYFNNKDGNPMHLKHYILIQFSLNFLKEKTNLFLQECLNIVLSAIKSNDSIIKGGVVHRFYRYQHGMFYLNGIGYDNASSFDRGRIELLSRNEALYLNTRIWDVFWGNIISLKEIELLKRNNILKVLFDDYIIIKIDDNVFLLTMPFDIDAEHFEKKYSVLRQKTIKKLEPHHLLYEEHES